MCTFTYNVWLQELNSPCVRRKINFCKVIGEVRKWFSVGSMCRTTYVLHKKISVNAYFFKKTNSLAPVAIPNLQEVYVPSVWQAM